MTAAVRRYFETRYPSRDATIARWFRAGEADRARVIAPWLVGARTVLDAGCGDGVLLASVVQHLDVAWLIDLSPRALASARAVVAHRAATVRMIAGDVGALELPHVDAALACGITDYTRDWPALVTRLRRVARIAIVDFAKPRTLRRWWLRANGLELHVASEADIRALAPDALVETRHHYVARWETRQEVR